jgi:hypothetical protein
MIHACHLVGVRISVGAAVHLSFDHLDAVDGPPTLPWGRQRPPRRRPGCRRPNDGEVIAAPFLAERTVASRPTHVYARLGMR